MKSSKDRVNSQAILKQLVLASAWLVAGITAVPVFAWISSIRVAYERLEELTTPISFTNSFVWAGIIEVSLFYFCLALGLGLTIKQIAGDVAKGSSSWLFWVGVVAIPAGVLVMAVSPFLAEIPLAIGVAFLASAVGRQYRHLR
jgi:ethanolamine transporter EutH